MHLKVQVELASPAHPGHVAEQHREEVDAVAADETPPDGDLECDRCAMRCWTAVSGRTGLDG
jgi:hypothetical protein